MDGETEYRQGVDGMEEQIDGTLSIDGVDITQPWLSAQGLAVAAADRGSPWPRIKRAFIPRIEQSSYQRQGTEFSQKRSSGAPLGGIVSPECTSGAQQETIFA